MLKFRYNSPLIQILLLGFVCFCCPGMYNALSGLGAGGRIGSDVYLTDSSNAALYACFAIVGFFAGSVNNTLGPRYTLLIGSVGYVLYTASLWVYDTKANAAFVIAAGAILGCCAGLLWTAQGSIMMSYPEEKNKGKYVSIFWTIFNLGGVLGSLIPLGLNLSSSGEGGVSTGTYTAFVVIMIVGGLCSLLICKPTSVIRTDGTAVSLTQNTTWKQELKGVVGVFGQWKILALLPAFLASNWFYSYQFGLNALYFDVATRSLNGTMYWAMQIVGSIMLGQVLDFPKLKRRNRGFIGLAITFVICMAVWAGGFVFQLGFDRSYSTPIHWTDPGFGGPFVLYIFYGFTDALYQTYLYWLMGAMSNDPGMLARYAGFYKAVQSAGGAISFGIDAVHTDLRWEALICWLLVFISFPLIAVVTWNISDTNITADDFVDTDTNASGSIQYQEKTEVAHDAHV
ncbi:major facilitator superfamily domain-containing protein [Umbelopsis sp. PMI_123]|nr:major facilitator superfamily domain-containing protein [Umbelopsis sp. PMI_123]